MILTANKILLNPKKMAALEPPFFCPARRQRSRSLGKSAHTDGPERSLFQLSIPAFPELAGYALCLMA